MFMNITLHLETYEIHYNLQHISNDENDLSEQKSNTEAHANF